MVFDAHKSYVKNLLGCYSNRIQKDDVRDNTFWVPRNKEYIHMPESGSSDNEIASNNDGCPQNGTTLLCDVTLTCLWIILVVHVILSSISYHNNNGL